ncbi:MAG: type II secretion system F family protein [Ornithinimicrobium sp.]
MSLAGGWASWLTAMLFLSAVWLWPTRSVIRGRAAASMVKAPPTRNLAPSRWLTRWRTRGEQRLDIVPLLDGLSASLAAGLTPEDSLRMAAQATTQQSMRAVIAPVLQAATQGRPLGAPWQRVARQHDHPDLSSLARAWLISERLGCPLADAVATTASTSRSRTMLQHRLDAATAGARATSTLLSVLPIGGVGIALTLGIDPITLYGNPLSMASALAGLSLLVGGRWLVRRMIARVGDRGTPG